MDVKRKDKAGASATRTRQGHSSSSADETRQRVIACTAKLIAQGGIAQLTIRTLARECGVSPMTLYNHFGSRGNVVSITVAQTFGTFFEPNPRLEPRSGDAIEELQELIDSLVQVIEKKRRISEALLAGYFSVEAEMRANDVLYGMLYKRLLVVAERMRADGVIAAWVHPQLVAGEVTIRILSAWISWTHAMKPHQGLRQAILFSVMSFILGLSQAKYSSRLCLLVRNAMSTEAGIGSGSTA